MLVCASPAYAARRGLPRMPDEIGGHRLIGMRSNPSQEVFAWEFAGAGGGVERRAVAPAFVVNDPEAAALAAAAGMATSARGGHAWDAFGPCARPANAVRPAAADRAMARGKPYQTTCCPPVTNTSVPVT